MNRYSLFLLLAFLLLALFITTGQTYAQSNKGIKIVSGGTAPAGTERRLALVVGNKTYAKPGASLQNPVNDADSMAAALRVLGFTVIRYTNLGQASFKQAVADFGEKLKGYDVGLVYYSGHGLQYDGNNYLVPTDAQITTEPQIAVQCVGLGQVLSAMVSAGAKTGIVILDACRNNPFKGLVVTAGLALPQNPPGTFVAFATSENSTADDNPGDKNGLFTSELLKHIRRPNLTLSQILTYTRTGVYARSNKAQTPADYNKLLGDDFVFIKTDKPTPDPPTPVSTLIAVVAGGRTDADFELAQEAVTALMKSYPAYSFVAFEKDKLPPGTTVCEVSQTTENDPENRIDNKIHKFKSRVVLTVRSNGQLISRETLTGGAVDYAKDTARQRSVINTLELTERLRFTKQ